MTRDEFERGYAAASGVSVALLRSVGRIAVPCDCGEDGCQGWQSRNAQDWWEDEWWKLTGHSWGAR